MIEKAIYRNHLGEEFRFGENGVYMNAGGLRDYTWKIEQKNNRISKFEKGIVSRPLNVVIMAHTEADGIAIRNRLFEIVEKDVLAMKAGHLIVGDHKLECFVTGSTKSKYLMTERYMLVKLTIQTDNPNWIMENSYSFYSDATTTGYEYLDYNFDFPIDYLSANNPRLLRNSGFTETNFKLIIYGYCENPSVTIGSHTYQVNCTVQDDEKLVIDSVKKTVVLIDRNRKETNVFNKRNRNSYIFKKIPAGEVGISFDGTFDFDVIIKEERSEPKWT